MFLIKKITAQETYSVRQSVLRKGQPIATCSFDDDNLVNTIHFGLFLDELLIGIITVIEKKLTLFNYNKQFQIRGMAVLDAYQKKGYGEDLIDFAQNYVESQKGDIIWLNARITAVGFYEKSNYKKIGSGFEIENIGVHYIMFKEINH